MLIQWMGWEVGFFALKPPTHRPFFTLKPCQPIHWISIQWSWLVVSKFAQVSWFAADMLPYVYSSIEIFLKKWAWISLKKKKKICVSHVEKNMMEKEVAMPPTRRKRGAMKWVNSTYTTHMHSLGLGLWLVAPFIQVFDLAINTMQCMPSYFPCPWTPPKL